VLSSAPAVGWLSECRACDRRIWALAGARLVVTAGYSMVMPFLAMHLVVDRHLAKVTVGVIWLLAGGLGAVCQWVAGELSDRVGRRPLMLAAMLVRVGILAGMGLAIDRHAPVITIAALTVANAMLRGFFEPAAAALVADLAPPHSRVAAYSLQRVGLNVGWAAGPAIAALAAGVPYAHLFYWAAPLTLLSTVGVWSIREPAMATSARRAFTLAELLAFTRDRTLLRVLLGTLGFFILQVQLFQTTSIYAASVLHLDRAQVGTLYTLNGILVVLLQLPAIHYINRLGTRRALMFGSLAYALSYASVGLARGHASLLACIAAVTVAEIFTSPAQQTAVGQLAPPGRTGAYMGLFGLSQVTGQSIGPLVGTTLLASLPPRAAWSALALFGVGAALGYRVLSGPSLAPQNPLAKERQA
jgi:MFS family permease